MAMISLCSDEGCHAKHCKKLKNSQAVMNRSSLKLLFTVENLVGMGHFICYLFCPSYVTKHIFTPQQVDFPLKFFESSEIRKSCISINELNFEVGHASTLLIIKKL